MGRSWLGKRVACIAVLGIGALVTGVFGASSATAQTEELCPVVDQIRDLQAMIEAEAGPLPVDVAGTLGAELGCFAAAPPPPPPPPAPDDPGEPDENGEEVLGETAVALPMTGAGAGTTMLAGSALVMLGLVTRFRAARRRLSDVEE